MLRLKIGFDLGLKQRIGLTTVVTFRKRDLEVLAWRTRNRHFGKGEFCHSRTDNVSFRQRCVEEVETGRSLGYFGFLLGGLTLRNSFSHL